mmetsp:Transcript_13427/g.18356  ORF Transcript_13427/g.18356 Transcript_13427/m.18356 type:complete len:596 (-) Transcript_13427:161-1948(-)|eukprot:CAMPEP_0196574104 /NCGR_PEP_ID=MMETSP1081-20130531/3873_1 /TAXON_ID=36882 /ORGANISM="Pyramimonas amylifera, Strain CCMP720" /LENGTH=595 /DNA_ID=CAMNT_0041892011 /DNA_START=164 /DNA_END=1951 /DNA_ORIENTATION=-
MASYSFASPRSSCDLHNGMFQTKNQPSRGSSTDNIARSLRPRQSLDLDRENLGRRNRLGHNKMQVTSKLSAEVASSAATDASEASSSGCPYTAVREFINPSKPVIVSDGEAPEYPGPQGNMFQNLLDVSVIGLQGMEKATLHFADQYGPIARFPNPIQLGEAAGWVFLNDPGLIEHVCRVNQANYSERFLPDSYLFATEGKGILGSGGEYNKEHRRMCSPFFQSKFMLQNYADTVVSKTSQLAEIWAKDGSITTDMAVQMQRLTLDIVGKISFSHDFGQVAAMEKLGADSDEIPTDRILNDINEAQEAMGKVFITPLPLLQLMSKLNVPVVKKMEFAFQDMRDAVMPIIKKRREERGDARVGDLLDVLLDAQEQEDQEGKAPYTDHELWEDVHDVMGAGHETTASTLTAALYSVSQHPEVDAKIQAELEAILGVGENARKPTYKDLEQLVYTQQVVKEVLRLYPPIPIFPRVAAGADTLPTGHQIVKNDVVFMSSYATGRSDYIWESPMTFDPERFSPENMPNIHRFSWVPFGAGPRMCMGGSFAMMSVTLSLVCLLQKTKVDSVKSRGKVFPIAYDITMHFPGNVDMTASPRYA